MIFLNWIKLRYIIDVLKLLNYLYPELIPNFFQAILEERDFGDFRPLNQTLIKSVDGMMSEDIPRIMNLIPTDESDEVKGAVTFALLIQSGGDVSLILLFVTRWHVQCSY